MDADSAYQSWILLIGALCILASWLPHALRRMPLSVPIVYVVLGLAFFALPTGLEPVGVRAETVLVERFTALIVIVALTTIGLRLRRPMGRRKWGSTWRLLGIAMPLSIAAAAGLGHWWLGLPLPTAVLLGAALAPTDPVLATDVQSPPPLKGPGGEVRFALTSEAGLNDGLAFPFTYLALTLAGAHADGDLFRWMWDDLLLKIAIGTAAGWGLGRVMGLLAFRSPKQMDLKKQDEGLAALAITLTAYGLTELIGGYGFLAVFVAALTLRRTEPEDEYHAVLFRLSDNTERVLVAVFLVILGGSFAAGSLAGVGLREAVFAACFLLIVRPAAGLISFLGSPVSRFERGAIAFFGIRGIGSVYYLAFGLRRHEFEGAGTVISTTLLVIAASILLHGVMATPVMRRVEARRRDS